MKMIWRTLLFLVALMPAILFAAYPSRSEAAPGDSASMVTSGANAELTFIDLMIPHHATAVAMSKVMLETGEHPELVQFAQDIINEQEAEIAQMKIWRNQWFPDADLTPLNQLMTSTAGLSVMDPALSAHMLRTASGSSELAFINAMILHNLSAVMMAEMVVPIAQNPELVDLAEGIIERLGSETEQLRAWRGTWFGVTG